MHIENAESTEKRGFIGVAPLPVLGVDPLFTPEAEKMAKDKQ